MSRRSIGRGLTLLLALAACARAGAGQARDTAALPHGAGAPSGAEAVSVAAVEEVAGAQGGGFGFERAANEFGVWGGGSWDSPTFIGKARDARLALLGLRYARVLARGDNLSLKYTLDAVPWAVLSYESEEPGAVRRRITGAGLSPVGFQLNFRRRERVQPFAQASGGFLYFGERVPEAGGAQFNFTADFGGGLQVKTAARRAWTFGYRYQHISNGYRAEANPGFDANVFYVGYSIFR
jgi:hypothetical protein